jgi:hypothetical protein
VAARSLNYLETQPAMLVNALAVAITAPSDSKAQQATQIALQLTQGLTEKQVDLCKKAALVLIEVNHATH